MKKFPQNPYFKNQAPSSWNEFLSVLNSNKNSTGEHTFSQTSQKAKMFHMNAKLDDYLTSEFGEHTFLRHLFKNSSDDKIRLEIYEDNENFRF